jgi:hypothetical protein
MIRFAGASGSGDFGMAKPIKSWPKYSAGPTEHLHAIGVLVTNHAEFESKLFQLFSHHLERIQMPKSLIKLFYSEWTTPQRLEATSKIFSSYDSEPDTKACVQRLRKYFNKCAEIRNQVGHSGLHPVPKTPS